jgi:transcription factor E2F3
MQNQTLIAIKAPHGTTLEVPDPDEVGCKTIFVCHTYGRRRMLHFVNGVNSPTQVNDYPQRRYRIVLRSTMGPIDVYLVRYMLIIPHVWHMLKKTLKKSECTSPT